MRPELRAFIEDYQTKVAEACSLLQERLDVIAFSRGRGDTAQTGYLDDAGKITYFFHGIGCRVAFEGVVVDFDYGPNGRFDGFDGWRLARFAESNPKYSQFRDSDALETELESLLTAGELFRSGVAIGSHLYFFKQRIC